MRTLEELSAPDSRPLILAHRGASFYHKENTLESFEAAIAMGSDMIEFDVRRSRDGILLVHHDPDFDGVKILDLTMEEILERSGSAGYKAPALSEVLLLCRGKVVLDVELKEAGYENQVIKEVLDILAPDQFLLSSMKDKVIREVKRIRPEIRTGLGLYSCPFPRVLGQLFPAGRIRRTGADVLVVSEGLLKWGFLRFAAGLGKPVWVYTRNDRKGIWKLITDPRVGGIFTDRPDVGMFLRELYWKGKNPEEGRMKDEG
ncbi:MAG: glycerophosphodiester phosphodiesterase [Proteobacteria bacterium]|nr:glycerophosphodiester phosphodiesterase [Pseudomonadota bacterium]